MELENENKLLKILFYFPQKNLKGLFDFQSCQVKTTTKLLYPLKDVNFSLNEFRGLDENHFPSFIIKFNQGLYRLTLLNNELENENNIKVYYDKRLWKIISSYKLIYNDIIKIGNSIFQVEFKESIGNNLKICEKFEKEKSFFCRICLSNEENEDFIQPCLCKGSSKNIHNSCFRNWLMNRTKIVTSDKLISLYINSYKCEICKGNYSIEKDPVEMLNFPLPMKKCFILKAIQFNEIDKSSICIHILIMEKLSNSEIRIGRHNKNDIIISDISISNFHAKIIFADQDTLTIKDEGSKFGTFVLIPEKTISITESVDILIDCIRVKLTPTIIKFT